MIIFQNIHKIIQNYQQDQLKTTSRELIFTGTYHIFGF